MIGISVKLALRDASERMVRVLPEKDVKVVVDMIAVCGSMKLDTQADLPVMFTHPSSACRLKSSVILVNPNTSLQIALSLADSSNDDLT